jgi:hypothetical protein
MANRASALAEWQFVDLYEPPHSTESLLARLREYCLPDGEDAAHQIRAVKIIEKGEMRSSPQVRWMPFTAEETIRCYSQLDCTPERRETSPRHCYGRLPARSWPDVGQGRPSHNPGRRRTSSRSG